MIKSQSNKNERSNVYGTEEKRYDRGNGRETSPDG